MNRFAQWALNLSVGAIAFVFFLMLLFPLEPLIRQGLAKLEAAKKIPYHIEVKKISPSLFFKTTFEEVAISDTASNKTVATFKKVKLGIHYMALLSGKIDTSFEMVGSQGSVDGNINLSKGDYQIEELEVEFNAFTLDGIQWFAAKLGFPLKGSLSGTVKLVLDGEKMNRNNGNIDLKLKNLMIPAGKFTPVSGFDLDLPDLLLTDASGGSIRAVIEDGKVDLKELKLTGTDLILNLKGKIQLNSKLDLSRVTLDGDFKYFDKIQQALPLVVLIEKEKNETGSYPLLISGRISNPKIKIGSKDLL